MSEALAAFLASLGVEVAYGLGGGSIVPFCHALARSRVRVLHCRHESGAAFAALEESLAKDRTTVVFTTAGPGITNAITGLAAARVEGARVILVSGGTSPSQRERGASQETTAKTIPAGLLSDGPLFHYATTVEHPSQLPVVLRRLTVGARAAEGFVAHIHLPLSVQSATFEAQAFAEGVTLPGPAPSAEAIEAVANILTGETCAIWVGFGARTAVPLVRALAERRSMLVMCSPRAKGIFPEDHPLFAGTTGVGGHARAASSLKAARIERTLVLGSRLWECTSFWRPDLVPPGGFVHVDVNPAVFGAAYPGARTVGVQAEIGAFLSALLPRLPVWHGKRPALPPLPRPAPLEPLGEGAVRPRFLFEAIQRVVVESSDAAVLTEAGSAFVWGNNVLRFQEPGRYRSGLHFGSMGHATTGVVGAARARGKAAVAVVGDGSMLMLGEVSTAVRYGIPAVWVVLNDRRYGIVEHGMRASGYDPVETTLPDTDFVRIAQGLGALGEKVEREEELEAALRAALAAGGPFVLDVRVDPEERPPITSRVQSLEAQAAKESVSS
ncbi:thiamine pyrophosphate-dependent enzyme [Polyangium spumosum]|uniref:thiamine pyrophosphate-dependent enzyme n=1 Tax=Polyangium spumosum TaxID=889282 RepID=UPI0014794E5C